MPTPTINQPAPAHAGKAPPVLIPFTRAARKKTRMISNMSATPGASIQQLPPLQIPANGYLRRLILDVTCTITGNIATVAFANDAPFSAFTQVSLAAANGDSLINPLSGFTLSRLQKYGCFSMGSQDAAPEADPNYYAAVGAVANGGSFHFQLNIPVEVDERDGLCALPNMAANQSFLLNMFLNTSGSIYATAPTTLAPVNISITAEYWAAPAPVNAQGIAQQTAPRVANAVNLLQTQMPTITPSSDQTVQLLNVGNTIRFIYFELRTAAGVRTDVDWPNLMNILVNNDLWLAKTKNNWQRQLGHDYKLVGPVSATPSTGNLDTGVFILDDFINSGSAGNVASASSNRDLMLVTGSGTALNIEAVIWGGNASQLLVVTNALRIPDPASFYAPQGV